ncbi:MAG: hypothetical protein SPI28_08870 [Acetatifactor sp.]|nr:hypothetical protein [Acetatifactor sp.]
MRYNDRYEAGQSPAFGRYPPLLIPVMRRAMQDITYGGAEF